MSVARLEALARNLARAGYRLSRLPATVLLHPNGFERVVAGRRLLVAPRDGGWEAWLLSDEGRKPRLLATETHALVERRGAPKQAPKISIPVPPELLDRLRSEALARGCSVAGLARALLTAGVA